MQEAAKLSNSFVLGMGFGGLQAFSAHLIDVRLLFFVVSRLLVFKATLELGRGKWEQDNLKHHRAHCCCQYSCFSLVKCSSDCYKPLIPKILKKLILTIFASVLTAFMVEQIFQGLYFAIGASLVAQRLKRLPPMRETRVRSLSWEDPLEKEMATHSSILAWRIPWTEEPGGLQSTGSQRVGHK